MTFDTQGESETEGDILDRVTCFLNELKTPEYVRKHIESTRALDGQQTDKWDGYEARWTYHPDNGLLLTIIDTQRTAKASTT